MKFISQKGFKYHFSPIYSIKEQSFFSKPDALTDFSIMIKGAYTSLDVSLILSTLCCISGYNPQKTWKKAKLIYPVVKQGSVKVIFDFQAEKGMGIDYAVNWETFYDIDTGIICICDSNMPYDVENIEFSKNTAASIRKGDLTAVWIRPFFVQ